ADGLELLGARALLAAVLAPVVERILRHPAADLVLRAVAAVVVVGRVWLVAVALELDQRWTRTGPRVLHRLPRLIKGVEHVHPIGDEAASPVPRRLVRDVRHGHLVLEARRD